MRGFRADFGSGPRRRARLRRAASEILGFDPVRHLRLRSKREHSGLSVAGRFAKGFGDASTIYHRPGESERSEDGCARPTSGMASRNMARFRYRIRDRSFAAMRQDGWKPSLS